MVHPYTSVRLPLGTTDGACPPRRCATRNELPPCVPFVCVRARACGRGAPSSPLLKCARHSGFDQPRTFMKHPIPSSLSPSMVNISSASCSLSVQGFGEGSRAVAPFVRVRRRGSQPKSRRTPLQLVCRGMKASLRAALRTLHKRDSPKGRHERRAWRSLPCCATPQL